MNILNDVRKAMRDNEVNAVENIELSGVLPVDQLDALGAAIFEVAVYRTLCTKTNPQIVEEVNKLTANIVEIIVGLRAEKGAENDNSGGSTVRNT